MENSKMHEILNIEGVECGYPRWVFIRAATLGAMIEYWPMERSPAYSGNGRRSHRRYHQQARWFDDSESDYYVEHGNRAEVNRVLRNVYYNFAHQYPGTPAPQENRASQPVFNLASQPVQEPSNLAALMKKKQMQQKLKKRSGIQSAHKQIKNEMAKIRRDLCSYDMTMIALREMARNKITYEMVELSSKINKAETRLKELEVARDVLVSFLKG